MDLENNLKISSHPLVTFRCSTLYSRNLDILSSTMENMIFDLFIDKTIQVISLFIQSFHLHDLCLLNKLLFTVVWENLPFTVIDEIGNDFMKFLLKEWNSDPEKSVWLWSNKIGRRINLMNLHDYWNINCWVWDSTSFSMIWTNRLNASVCCKRSRSRTPIAQTQTSRSASPLQFFHPKLEFIIQSRFWDFVNIDDRLLKLKLKQKPFHNIKSLSALLAYLL